MTTKAQMPDVEIYDYDLKFDVTECGSAQYTYYGLVTDYGSPADILVRWPERGFGRKVDNAAEKAEALSKEIVKRWNAYREHTDTHEALQRSLQEAMDYITRSGGALDERWLKALTSASKKGEG